MDYKMIEGTEAELEVRRKMRQPLLKAFDVYKTNVEYGVVEETAEEHEAIIAWYKSILDLDQHALTATSIPSKIAKYL